MLGLSGTSSYAVFVYFVFVFFVFARLTHGNIIFDTLEQSSFQKYAICWVFPALGNVLYLCICVFVYLYLCIFVWDTWEYQFRYPWTKSFQKMYGLYGLKHHKVERLKRWRTDRQTDRISSCRLDPSCRRGRVKIDLFQCCFFGVFDLFFAYFDT